MPHYICTGGCGGVSNEPGVCQATNCPKHGQPLEQCDCTDGMHYGKQQPMNPEDTASSAPNESEPAV